MSTAERILIIDDSRSLAETVAHILCQSGYQVFVAFNGPAGLEKAQALKPDLIILDIMMPGMDGYEVCRRLQDNPETAHASVLFLSVLGDMGVPADGDGRFEANLDYRLRAFDVGAVDFLTKPTTMEELLTRVQALLWASAHEERFARSARSRRRRRGSERGDDGRSTTHSSR
ncbi:MAG: response regulator [Chloroflexota bacterium]